MKDRATIRLIRQAFALASSTPNRLPRLARALRQAHRDLLVWQWCRAMGVRP